MTDRLKKCLELFWEMFKISLFVIGGGYSILAVADSVFSKRKKWLCPGELLENLPVFQMVPGIIAGSTAIYTGRKIAGAAGAASALAGVVLPSVIVFSAVSACYAKIPFGNAFLSAAFLGLRSALTGIICAMVVKSWRKSLCGVRGAVMMLVALYAIGWEKLNPAFVIAAMAFAGIAVNIVSDVSRRNSSRRSMFSSIWLMPLLFFKYGLISFGGGYVLVPVYLNDFVGKCARFLQLTENEFADIMALTQITPGPIAVNCATFFGYRLSMSEFGSAYAAVPCAIAATVCLLLPGSILLYFALESIERFKTSKYVCSALEGIKPATIAMMLNALWAFAMTSVFNGSCGSLSLSEVNWTGAALSTAAAFAVGKYNIGAVAVILGSTALSVIANFICNL